MHSLIILSLVILYLIAYLMQKVNYICFTYHTRAGGRAVGAFLGRFSDFWGFLGGRVRLTVVLWIVGGRLGRFACVFGRVVPCVRARGYAPPIFRARPIPGSLPSHSVRRICGGISRVWGECECE